MFGPQLWLNLVRAAKYLRAPELAGGMSRLDAIYAGMGGMETSQNPNDRIVHIRDDGTGKYATFVEQRGQTGLYDSAQLYAIGQRQARMLPYAAGSAFRAAPTQIYAAYKPIHALSQGAANQFRRQQLPRVTGLEGLPTLAEMVKDALNGARVGVGSLMPTPFSGPPKPYADLWWLLSQLWGRYRPKDKVKPTGTSAIEVRDGYGTYSITTTWISQRSVLKRCTDGAQVGNQTYAESPGTVNFTGYGLNFTPGDVLSGSVCGAGTNNQTTTNLGTFRTVQADGSLGPPTYKVTGVNVGYTYNATNTANFRDTVRLDKITKGGVDLTPYQWGAPVPTPEIQPEVAQPPKLPPLITPVTPAPQEPEPEPQPGVAPVEPGPAKKPAVVPMLPPRYYPLLPPSPTGTKDGAIVPRPPTKPATTPSDVVFPVPGGQPVGGIGQAPQPTMEGIAQEVGRIERKLEQLMSPQADTAGEKWKLLWNFLDAMWEKSQGGTYTLREPCDPDGDGVYEQRTQDWHGGFTAIGTVMSKIDAVAALLQDHKDLKQPICREKPQLMGDWVSVNFLSDMPPPDSKSRMRKTFRYRDQNAAPLLDHVQHWENFAWDAGPVIVISKNLSWGTPQVWASTAAEGKRVIQHAATIAGVNLNDPKHQWIVTGSPDPRYGRTGRMRVNTRGGEFVRITSRPGPSGPPTGVAPHP